MEKNYTDRHRSLKVLVIGLLSLWMTACAGKSSVNTVFWPAPPDLPRIQFLKSIKDSNDVVTQKNLSLLSLGDGKGENFVNLVKPYGIAVAKGKIYVCDTIQADIMIIDLPNKKMSRLAGNINAGRLKKPVNVAVDSKENLYVADTSRLEVLQYAPDGSYVRSFGAGKDMKPIDVRVDDDFLYVLDRTTSRVHLFDRASGDFLRSIGSNEDPKRSLAGPTNMANDSKGALYVSNFGSGRIIKLDRDGNFLMGYGKLGSGLVDFARPRGITVDQEGLVYVVDAAAQHVQVFDEQMRILMLFGGPGTAGSLNIPAGIAVSTDNLDYYQSLAAPGFKLEKVLFVVSQVGDHKVGIYGLGKKQGPDYEADVQKTLSLNEQKAAEAKERQRKLEEEKALKESLQGPGPGTATPQAATPETGAAPAR